MHRVIINCSNNHSCSGRVSVVTNLWHTSNSWCGLQVVFFSFDTVATVVHSLDGFVSLSKLQNKQDNFICINTRVLLFLFFLRWYLSVTKMEPACEAQSNLKLLGHKRPSLQNLCIEVVITNNFHFSPLV